MKQDRTSDAGRGAAAAAQDDGTLSAVRQMMEQAAHPAAVRERSEKPAEAPAAQARRQARPAQPEPPAEPQPAARVSGLDALPELGASEPVESPPTPAPGLMARLGGLLGRRGRAAPDDDAPVVENRVADPDDFSDLTELSPPGLGERAMRAVKRRVAEFNPTKKQAAVVAVIAVMVWRPWLIPGLLFLAFWLALIAYFTLGPDRVAELGQAGRERFAKRHPERAARWLAKVQGGADKVDGWLARLPESWTDGIYLPDLGRSAVQGDPVADRDDPFERLAAEREAGLGDHGPLRT